MQTRLAKPLEQQRKTRLVKPLEQQRKTRLAKPLEQQCTTTRLASPSKARTTLCFAIDVLLHSCECVAVRLHDLISYL
jgi:hypothetical protein